MGEKKGGLGKKWVLWGKSEFLWGKKCIVLKGLNHHRRWPIDPIFLLRNDLILDFPHVIPSLPEDGPKFLPELWMLWRVEATWISQKRGWKTSLPWGSQHYLCVSYVFKLNISSNSVDAWIKPFMGSMKLSVNLFEFLCSSVSSPATVTLQAI